MSTFQYVEELNDAEIRLLRLHPGEWLDDLKATLYVSDRLQQYTALSYAWGSTKASNDITVNSKIHKITFNLDRALRALRRQTEPVLLWVDSICINQHDATEKSHQVRLMHDIFSRATEVVAYIGDGLDRSRKDYSHRFEKLGQRPPVKLTGSRGDKAVAQQYLIDLWKQPPGLVSEYEEILCLYSFLVACSFEGGHDGFIDQRFPSLVTSRHSIEGQKIQLLSERMRLFATSDWWNRMWIIQEACVARSLIIAYGRITIPFGVIVDATANCLRPSSIRSKELTQVISYLSDKVEAINVLHFRGTFNDASHITTSSSLLWLLRRFRNRKSSEPRDKIFALKRLSDDLAKERIFRFQTFTIPTDYGIGVNLLFSKVAYQIIRQTGLLWMTTSDLLAKSRKDIPSWVPDWSSDNVIAGFDQRRFRLHGESYLRFNASRAMFRKSPDGNGLIRPDPQGNTVTPQYYFKGLLDGHDNFRWKALHRLPSLVDYTESTSPWAEGQRRFALLMNGVSCGRVEAVSDAILSDLSNIDSVVHQIHLGYRLQSEWLNYQIPLLETVATCLCSGLQVSEDNGGSFKALKSQQRQLVALWLLQKCGVFGGSLTSCQQETYDSTKICPDGYGVHLMASTEGEDWRFESLEIPCSDSGEARWNRSSWTPGWFQLARIPKDFNPQQPVKVDDSQWIEDTVRNMSAGFRVFVTHRGQIGVGPESMRTGDEVCILEGGLLPYVLRKSTRTANSVSEGSMNFFEWNKLKSAYRMTMMGSCFVDGIMHWGSETGEWDDNPDDIEALDSKLRRKLRSNDIFEKSFLLL